MIFDNVTLRISANCSEVKRVNTFEFSYQNLSHLRKERNCRPSKHPIVGPTSAPCKEFSAIPPVNRSMSSTCLLQ